MNHKLLSFILLLNISVYADDTLWIENNWISDKIATRAANPAIEQASKETIEKFTNFFGKNRWEISNGILTSFSDEYEGRFELIYTINPAVDDSYDFEIVLTDNEGSYSTIYIWRIETGFCMNMASSIVADIDRGWSLNTWKVRGGDNFIECFKRYDT